MKKLALIALITLSQFASFGQERKNEISYSIGISTPSGEHSDEYATAGFFNNLVYKRMLNEKWKITVGFVNMNFGFDEDGFMTEFNKSSPIEAREIDATSWSVSSLNIGAEWKFYKELYLIMGLDIYGANYPEQNIYLKNSTTIGVKASVGSGIGANVGLGYNFKIGKNERWEIPVFFSSHFGSIDYGDFTVTDKSSGISVVSTSTPVGFNSFNLGAGITYKF